MIQSSQESDYKTIKQAIRDVCPHLFVFNLQQLNGAQNLTYLVNDTLIVRFFKSASIEKNIVNQKQQIDFLAPRISYPVPHIDIHTTHINNTPQIVTVSPKLEGKILSPDQFAKLDVKDKERIFTHLSSFLGEIHSIDSQAVKDISIPSHAEMFLNLLPQMPKMIRKTLENRINGFVSPKCLCHYDLHPGNYLIDKNKNVCGVLDFDLMCWGNPIWDVSLGFFYSSKDLSLFKNCYEKQTNTTLRHFSSAVLLRKLLVLAFVGNCSIKKKLESQKVSLLLKKMLPHAAK